MPVHKDISITTIDSNSPFPHAKDERRKLSEYSRTNAPLSEYEIEQDEAIDPNGIGWAPRTIHNIHDLTPLPEKGAPPPQE